MITRIRQAVQQAVARIYNHELLLPSLGMFFGYICHDALQERMFRFDGFEYGWFMTLAEVTIMLLLGQGCMTNGHIRQHKTSTIRTTAVMGLCIAISHGCGNTALLYSTYPLKVAFKSCKLIPTMWLGLFITKRTFTWNQYLAAVIMCVGLVILTLADNNWSSPASSTSDGKITTILGPLLLVISTSLDSLVPNLQERLFHTTPSASTKDVMFLCNSFMFLLSLLYTLLSGELQLALTYCHHNKHVLLVLFLQAVSATIGLQCYLTVVVRHGGVAAVLLANVRKIVTIGISFLLFRKPFSKQHAIGLGLMCSGVYLGVKHQQQQRRKVGKKLDEMLDKKESNV